MRVKPSYPRSIVRGSATVKIYRKTDRGACRYNVVYASGGARRFHTYTDEAEAVREATARAEDLARGDHEAAAISGADRAALAEAHRELEPLGVSLVSAVHAFAEAFRILGGNRVTEAARLLRSKLDEQLPSLTVAEAVARYCADKEALGISYRHRADMRFILERGFASAFRCPLASVTSGDLREYLNRRSGGAVSRNNHRRGIAALFNYAKRNGWISKAEAHAASALEKYEEPRRDVEIFKPAEVAALLANADRDLVPWIALVAFGGLRHDEVTTIASTGEPGLCWEAIDFAKGVLVVPAAVSKVKRKRKIALPPNLLEWLAPYRGSSGPIFAKDPRRSLAAATRAAGVKWKRNALRHSFGSYRMESVKNAGQVALEMGNSPGIVLRHYHEIVSAEDAAEYWAIRPSV
ncbi:MAG: hypothetical protein JSR82_23885 [Verrucomicrobia bacterium]|nr:hypothetical protein [Verrucomicrobiota bacterium]